MREQAGARWFAPPTPEGFTRLITVSKNVGYDVTKKERATP